MSGPLTTATRVTCVLVQLGAVVWLTSGCTPADDPPPVSAQLDGGPVDMQTPTDLHPTDAIADATPLRLDVDLRDATLDAAVTDAAAVDLAVPPAECLEPGQLDDACDPGGNCCADGLVCADFGGGGRCVTQCDARRPDCGPRALCVPLALPEGDRPTPGACLQSARCEVDAAPICGPETTCTVLTNITLCTRAGEVAPGDACTVFADEPALCAAGSTCLLGACRPGCADGCAGAARCVDFSAELDGAAFAFCFEGCDVFAQAGCADGMTCTVGAVAPTRGQAERQALGVCVDRPDGMGVQNQICAPVAGVDWGDCRGGHLCQRLTRDAPPRCLGRCDDVDRSLCVNGSLCVDDLPGVSTGVCIGDCTVWPEPGDKRCAAGEICRFEHIGRRRDGTVAPGGLCRPGSGQHGTGEACALDPESGDHSCAQGHICAELEAGAPPVCLKLCERAADGQRGCGEGEGCVDAFGDPQIGVCLAGFRQ